MTCIRTTSFALLLILCAGVERVNAGGLPDIRRAGNRVIVVSHRANFTNAPENSLAAIKACINGGVDMVEIDVAKTKDGTLVLMHDSTVDRTTNGSGKIAEMEWVEVKKLRLRKTGKGPSSGPGFERNATAGHFGSVAETGSPRKSNAVAGKGGELTEETVPALVDVLKLCKDRIYVNIDLKGTSIFDCAAVIKETGTEKMIMFRASNLTWLTRVAAALPRMHISPRLDFRRKDLTWPDEVTLMEVCKPYRDAFEIWGLDIPFRTLSHPAVSKDNLKALKAANLHAWALTLNKVSYGGFRDRHALKQPEAVWGKLIDRGFSVIMTDEPEALIKYLEERHVGRSRYSW